MRETSRRDLFLGLLRPIPFFARGAGNESARFDLRGATHPLRCRRNHPIVARCAAQPLTGYLRQVPGERAMRVLRATQSTPFSSMRKLARRPGAIATTTEEHHS